MSTTIDNKIVKMQFDNAKFEAGVSQSMSTLDKLKEKLSFKGASKGFEELQTSINKTQFGQISKSLDNLEHRFSAVGIAGMEVVKRLTNNVLDSISKVSNATLGQIKSGGWSRAMNLANAQFTVEGLKLDWKEMLKAINYGVQDTAYGLDAAAKAASSLAASGVSYKESIDGANDSLMHTSLRAISGVAAMTNSSYEDISRIFTTIAGNGRLMGDQLLQLSSRGLNVAATLGETLHMTEADIRDLVSKGKISFEVFASAMDDAFGAHAKDANKTFEGSLSNMKAALSRVGALFATPIIEKTNTFFIAVTGRIKEVQKALSDVKDEDGKVVKKGFASYFAEAWEAAINFASKFIDNIDMSWFETFADKLSNIAQFITDIFNRLSDQIDETVGAVKDGADVISVAAEHVNAALQIFFGGKFGNGLKRIQGLTAAGLDAKKVQKFLNEYIKAGYDIGKMQIKFDDLTSEEIEKYIKVLQENGYDFKKVGELVAKNEEDLKDLQNTILRAREKNITGTASVARRGDGLKQATGELVEMKEASDEAKTAVDELKEEFTIFNSVYFTIQNLASAFGNVVDSIKFGADTVINLIRDTISPTGIVTGIELVTQKLKNITGTISAFAQMLLLASNNAIPLYEGLPAMGDRIEYVGGKIKYLEWQERINAIYKALKSTVNHTKVILGNLLKAVITIGGAISRAFRKVFRPDDVASGIDSFGGTVEKLSEIILKAAEVLSPVIETVFTGIFKVAKFLSGPSFLFKPIVDLLGEIFGVKEAVEETDSATRNLLDTANNSGSLISKIGGLIKAFIEKIPGTLETIYEKISKLPDFLKRLKDELAQREGVQRLIDNCKALADIITAHLSPAIDNAKDGLKSLSSDDGAGKDAFTILVDVIDWIADKLAWVVGMLPVVGSAIYSFFAMIKDGATTAFNALTGLFGKEKKDDIGEVGEEIIPFNGENVKEAFDSNETRGAVDAAKDFGSSLSDAFANGAGKIDLSKIGGILGLIGAFKLLKGIGGVVQGVVSVMTVSERAIKAFGYTMKSFGNALNAFSYAQLIVTSVESIAALIAMVWLVSKIPEDDLNRATGVVVSLGVLLYLFLTGLRRSDALFTTLSPTMNSTIQKGVGNVVVRISGLAAIAMLLLSIGSMIKNVAIAFEIVSKIDNFVSALVKFAILFGVIAALSIGVYLAANKLNEKFAVKGKVLDKSAATIGAIAGLMLAVGFACVLVAAAVRLVPKDPWESVGAIGAVMTMMFLFAAGIETLSKNAHPTAISKAGSLILKLAVALALIVVEIAAMAVMIKVASVFTKEGEMNPIWQALTLIGIVIGAIAILVAIATSKASSSNAESLKNLSKVFTSVALLVGVVAAAMYFLAGKDGLAGAAIAVILGVGIFLGEVIAMLAIMRNGKVDKGQIEVLSDALLMVALAVAAFGIAVGYMAKFPIKNIWSAAGAIMAFFTLFLGGGALIGILGGKKADKIVLAISEIASAMLIMGLSIVAVGSGVLLLANGLNVLSPIIPVLLDGLDKLFSILEDHWLILVVITAAIAAIGWIVSSVSKMVSPFATAFGRIVEKIADVGGEFVKKIMNLGASVMKGLGDLIKTGASKVKTWFSGLGTKGKAIVGGLILTLCMAITDNGPTVLKTIGTFLWNAIDAISQSIGPIVEKLVMIVVSIIDGLADSILKHSNRIAAAIWGVVGALLGLLGSIIDQGLIMLLGPIGESIVGWLHGNGINIADYYKNNVKRMRELAEASDNFDPSTYEWEKTNKLSFDEMKDQILKDLKKVGENLGYSAYDSAATSVINGINTGTADVEDYLDKEAQEVGNLTSDFFTKTDLLAAGFKYNEHTGKWYDATNKITEEYKHLDENGKEVTERIGVQFNSITDQAGIWAASLRDMGDVGDDILARLRKVHNGVTSSAVESNADAGNEAANKYYDNYGDTADARSKDEADDAAKRGESVAKAQSDAQINYMDKTTAELVAAAKAQDNAVYATNVADLAEFKSTAQKLVEAKDASFIMPVELGGYGATLDQLKSFNFSSYQDYLEYCGKEAGNESGEQYTNSFMDTINSLIGKVSGSDGAGSIIDAMGGVGEDSGESTVMGWISSFMGGTDQMKIASATTLKEGVTDPIKSTSTQKVVETSYKEGVVNPAVNAISNSKSDMSNAMHHAFYGLEEAFQIRRDNFVSRWESFVNSLPAVMRNLWEIRSPSRVFEQIAEYVMAGFTRGIDYNAGDAIDSMSGMSTSIVDAFGNPLMKVAKIASGEIQYDPSIRPVLDTSAIGYGAQNINSMFDNQNISLSGLSGQLATDVGEMQASNADIIAELQALREEMTILGDNMADMQIVMDSGALVGAITPGVDRALGMRNIYRGRGN